MRQAIVTKYLGPTNTRGARVKATSQAGSTYVAWDHAHNTDRMHYTAAIALASKLAWSLDGWIGGALPSGDGYAFVQTETAPAPTLQTRAILAGAYRGKSASLNSTLTHAVECTATNERALCGRVDPDSLADPHAMDTAEAPTCKVCLARDPRFSGRG